MPIANCASPLVIAASAFLRSFAGSPPESHAILHRQTVEPRRELAVMLLGEDFGRRHERDLVARLDGLQRRQRGDDGLAAADIALQQALHRLAARQVAPDLGDDALLRARERERQPLAQCVGQRSRCPAAAAPCACARAGDAS